MLRPFKADDARITGVLASFVLHAAIVTALVAQSVSLRERSPAAPAKPVTVILLDPAAGREQFSSPAQPVSKPRRLPASITDTVDIDRPSGPQFLPVEASPHDPVAALSVPSATASVVSIRTGDEPATSPSDDNSVRDEYSNRLWLWIKARRPSGIHLRGEAGLTFSVDRNGALSGVVLTKPSGNGQLDVLAMRTLRIAAPFPTPPEQLGDADLRFTLIFNFR